MPHRSARHAASILGLAALLVAGGSAGAQTGPARVVKDINSSLSSSSGSDPGQFAEFQGVAFFTAFAPGLGKELWKSDGTEAGTVLVKDVAPGPAYSYARDLTVVQDTLFFYADDEVHGFELWKSDGTEAGTVLVKDINPGPGISFPLDAAPSLASAGGLLFFVANDGVHGTELWKSDGTESGTTVVREIGAGGPAYPGQLTAIQDTVVFVASDGTHGGELWKSDGTAAGTEVLVDLRPGSAGSNPWVLGQAAGLVYFTASFEPYSSYSALLRTDGTSGGTYFVQSFYYLYGSRGIEHAGSLFFRVQGFLGAPPTIWRSDGSADGTGFVGQFPSAPTAWIAEMTAWKGDLYVVVGAGVDERLELWKMSDAGDATHLRDFRAGGTGTFIYSLGLTAADGALVFRPFDPAYGFELWRSDGTAEGTVLVQDLAPGIYSGQPAGMTLAGSRLFFAAYDAFLGRELWAGRAAILARRPDRALQDLGQEIRGLVLPIGIERSLMAKLRAAETALHQREGSAACMSLLEAFVRQVEALSSTQISGPASAELVEFTQEIVALLDDPPLVSPPPLRGAPAGKDRSR